MGRQRILLGFSLIGIASVFIPRVSYTTVRPDYICRVNGIELTLPSSWNYDVGPWESATKANGTLILRASEAPIGFQPAGVQVLKTSTEGASNTQDFYTAHREKWKIVPKGIDAAGPREGDWKLDDATAHFIEWKSETEARCDVYVLDKQGLGWHLEFYAEPDRYSASRPTFEKIAKSILFD